ncbi:iron dependent repressor, metal binding and dimerization domain protein [Oscillospiraceae bacterium MB08-C2-2]|nr:iron dependent repressor, metal binding and dimerization domain protein [Oscillospiraceae bacterium MB08-C2-2]
MKDNTSSQYHTVRGFQLMNKQDSSLTPAMEDYLEMAFKLCLQDGYTRVGRLSEQLHVRPSSASKMILKLTELGYLEYDRNESIQLTKKGRENGQYLLDRHQTMEAFLTLLGSRDPLKETEQIEHFLSSYTISRLKVLVEFLTLNPQCLPKPDDGETLIK